MLPPNFVSLIITFIIFWSRWTLDGVVSDPQTHLVRLGCTPSELPQSTNFSGMEDSLNATFRDIREQIITQNKYFVTAQEGRGESPAISTLFQCRNYLSVHDCVACFDVAAVEIRHCPAAALGGGRVFYDGCFLRHETSAFFDKTTEDFNAVLCGNQTVGETTIFNSTVLQVLMNLQTTTPEKQGFFAATKIELPEINGTTIYAFAQCIETITQSGCFQCLNIGYNNMPTCLPNSDGRAYADGCFMRYSTTSFFPDNYQTIDVTPASGKQASLLTPPAPPLLLPRHPVHIMQAFENMHKTSLSPSSSSPSTRITNHGQSHDRHHPRATSTASPQLPMLRAVHGGHPGGLVLTAEHRHVDEAHLLRKRDEI